MRHLLRDRLQSFFIPSEKNIFLVRRVAGRNEIEGIESFLAREIQKSFQIPVIGFEDDGLHDQPRRSPFARSGVFSIPVKLLETGQKTFEFPSDADLFVLLPVYSVDGTDDVYAAFRKTPGPELINQKPVGHDDLLQAFLTGSGFKEFPETGIEKRLPSLPVSGTKKREELHYFTEHPFRDFIGAGIPVELAHLAPEVAPVGQCHSQHHGFRLQY